MKIKNISCTQFAGIRDCNLSFTEGINVICGANESGKSTTANLIARTLFQKAKIDRRSDKAFCELYFPSVRRDSDFTGDFADGKITFETNQGIYTLSKEWGTDARCTLSTPNGIVRDQKKIDEILKDALVLSKTMIRTSTKMNWIIPIMLNATLIPARSAQTWMEKSYYL